ncbi:MAG: hypothetical protein MK212_02405 [Saprospiraceae bacterium]|nr:hypothetical protein [Saprospiraceae bacterium]
MKFLSKSNQNIQKVTSQQLSYSKVSDRSEIKRLLSDDQKGFCAYSECYITEIHSPHIEHFDGRLKNTDEDNYKNWYLCLAHMNLSKPKKIDPYLPILNPQDPDLKEHVIYDKKAHLYYSNPLIETAINLIKYLGMNKPELVEIRRKHVERIKSIFDVADESLKQYLKNHKQELSYITALEAEFDTDFSELSY